MSLEASVATCPRCGSGVRGGSDWCTLCFADLRPPPPVLTIRPAPMATDTGAAGVQLPCSSCGVAVPLDLGRCPACGTGLFDQLREAGPVLTLPGLGDVMRFGKQARIGIALGVAVLAVIVLFALIGLAGALF